jgi:Domain of unknown function (DUF4386)
MDRPATASPQVYARVGGVLYLLVFGLGFTLFAYPHVGASGDPAATLRTISSSEPWLRVVSGAELINFVLDVPLALIFYVLLAPVDRNIALLAAFFRLANAFLGAAIGLSRLGVLLLVAHAGQASAFTPSQVQALAALSLALHGYGLDICFVFFGIHCILLGWLLYRSGYFPKFLGVLLPIAGLIYLTDSFLDIVAPALSAKIPNAVLIPGFVAELALCVWLLVRGVDVPIWEEKARRSAPL